MKNSRRTSHAKVLKAEQSFEQENGGLPRLSRSPHPYSRRSFRLESPSICAPKSRDGVDDRESQDIASGPTTTKEKERRRSQNGQRHSSDTASSSDAEEEQQFQFKALPPPSTKPSKGLRIPSQNGGQHDITPLLTPTALHEAEGRLANGYFDETNGSSISQVELDKLKIRFETKRRLSLIHRGCEVPLLVVITLVVLNGEGVWEQARRCSRVIFTAMGIVGALFVLYPLRLTAKSFIQCGKLSMRSFQIPAAFDPAPVLYPPILPVLVALSIAPGNANAVLPSLVLGLSSVPAHLVPQIASSELVSSVHWALTMLLTSAAKHNITAGSHIPTNTAPHVEILALLFPLHRNLLAVITSLTTTSLLSSEAQLLTVALINLLLLSATPQAKILSIILWTGGLSLFVFCSHIVESNVALERVPVQQLKRAGRALSTGSRSFVASLADSLGGQWQGDDGAELDDKSIAVNTSESSTTYVNSSPLKPTRPSLRAQRTNTRERSSSFRTTRTLMLTPQQIEMRKWAYAIWTYLIIIIVILLPIRYLVQGALNAQEPFGWALGYVFGDIPALHNLITTNNLQSWIPLSFDSNSTSTTTTSLPHPKLAPTPTPTLRLLLILHALLTLTIGITTVLLLTPYLYIDTRRKIFHFTMVVLLLPTLPLDPCFFALALSLILALFLLLDFIRAAQLRPLSKPLARFLTPYVDGRDLRGPVVVSHIFLLIGCAIPLWLSLGGVDRAGDGAWSGWEIRNKDRGDISMLAGVVCVGMGDAAASLVGRRYGKRKWMWGGGKSLEGSAAFAGAVVVGLSVGKVWIGYVEMWRMGGEVIGNGFEMGMLEWFTWGIKAIIAAMGASFMETVLTGCNDNVVVPVVLWLLVRGLRL